MVWEIGGNGIGVDGNGMGLENGRKVENGVGSDGNGLGMDGKDMEV